jgi:hypothetical protein
MTDDLKLPAVMSPSDIAVPKMRVVDERGNEIVRPDVLAAITQMAQLGQMVRMRKALERKQIQGRTFQLIFDATSQVQSYDILNTAPYIPWASMALANLGPDPVWISINNLHDYFKMLRFAELPVDYTEADRRIELLAYKCDAGQSASIQVIPTY